jgi:hypothetical protein
MRTRFFARMHNRLPVICLVGAVLIIVGWLVFSFFEAMETLNADWRYLDP